MNYNGPHQGQPVLHAGTPLTEARAALILVHGRGADASSIMDLGRAVRSDGVACFAPQASDNTWYPNRFLVPIESNEPGISSGLRAIDEMLQTVLAAGLGADRVILLGFSQGACLTLEFAARHARRYGGVVGLSGALIGPDGTPRDYAGGFEGAPVFLGCSDFDAHIPESRVHEAADVFRRMGAVVDSRIYQGMGHTVNPDEVGAVRAIVREVLERSA